MANNGTAEVAEKAAQTANDVEDRIKELLAPLLSDRDQLTSEVADCKAAYEEKKAELRSVEKVLQANALISPQSKGKSAPSPYKDLTAPSAPRAPRTQRAEKAQAKVLETIKAQNGEPFQIGSVMREAGVARRHVETVVGFLRGEDKVRLIGERLQIDREMPGGRKAATFQEIS